MIESTDLGKLWGYNHGFDLPLRDRTRIATLAAAPDDIYATRELDKIVAAHRPPLPRGIEDHPRRESYADAYRRNFVDGACEPGPHRKLVDA